MYGRAGQYEPRATGIRACPAGSPRCGRAGRALLHRTRRRRWRREIERWFLAATLYGTRISAAVAERTFGVLSDAGLARIGQARHMPLDDFIAFLDEGGSAGYAARTAARLKALSGIIGALRRAGRHDRPAVQHLPRHCGQRWMCCPAGGR